MQNKSKEVPEDKTMHLNCALITLNNKISIFFSFVSKTISKDKPMDRPTDRQTYPYRNERFFQARKV